MLAKKCLRKSIFLDPRVASNYNTLGIILKLEGHHIDAYRCFLKAERFQHGDAGFFEIFYEQIFGFKIFYF